MTFLTTRVPLKQLAVPSRTAETHKQRKQQADEINRQLSRVKGP